MQAQEGQAQAVIRGIIGWSLRFRLLVLGIAAAVMVVGITQLRNAPVDVLPEFSPAYVEVQTEALGLSAQEVEQLITVPLEADLLNGVAGVDVIRSESVPGLSSIVLVFDQETDVYTGRQLVQERLTQAHALPNVSKPPTMLQPLSSSSRVMMIGLSSKKLSPIERSVLARWTVRPRLMGVPGVANVSIWGQRERQLQVQVDPERLRQRGVTLNQVITTAGNAQVVSPLSFLEASTPGTGGFIETPNQRLSVQHVLDKLATPGQLGKVPIEGTGSRLRLADVAQVKVDHQPLIGDAVLNGDHGLLLVVEKFPGANTLEVTNGVEDALDKLRPGLSGMQVDSTVFRPATFIQDAIDNLTLTLVIATLLLALVLAAFMFQWRTVLICLVTIPLSLLTAALVLDLLGKTFNAIAFAGLAVALAVVIDDAVSAVENAARRLREQRVRGGGEPTATVVLEASAELRSSLAYATLIALVVVVPVFVMEGRPGAFFEPLALSWVLAVLASMLVALTVTPVLSLLLLNRPNADRSRSPALRRLAGRYAATLAPVLRSPRAVLIAVGGCIAICLAALPLLGTSLVPTFKDRDVLVRLDAQPGTSEPKMTRIAASTSRQLLQVSGVESVGAHVGRAVTGDQVVGVDSSELWLSIAADADYDATMASIERVVGRVPEVRSDVVTYSRQRIRDVGALYDGEAPNTGKGNSLDVLTGTDKPLTVRVYGENREVLRQQASRVRELMAGVDGVVNPRVEPEPVEPVIEVEVDVDKARRFGIKPGEVRRAEATLLQGIQVGSLFEQQKVFDVVVQGVPGTRRSVSSVRRLLIDSPEGGHVRLGQVADVRVRSFPAVIRRDAVSRRIDVESDISGRSLHSVAGDVEDQLSRLAFPIEYHAEVLEQSTGEEIGSRDVLGFAIAAALAVFLLLQAAFRSWRLAALVIATLPVVLVGGLLAALIDGATLSLGSLIGLLALFVLAVRGAVVLIRHLQRLERGEGEAFGPSLVERGAGERLAPAVTSTAAIAVVMAPFAVRGDIAGLEVVHPMAIVVLGGLVTHMLLALFVLPALYLRFWPGAEPGREPEDELLYRWAGIDPASVDGDRAPVAANGPVAPLNGDLDEDGAKIARPSRASSEQDPNGAVTGVEKQLDGD